MLAVLMLAGCVTLSSGVLAGWLDPDLENGPESTSGHWHELKLPVEL